MTDEQRDQLDVEPEDEPSEEPENADEVATTPLPDEEQEEQ